MTSFRRKKDSLCVMMKRKYSFLLNLNPRSMNYEANSPLLSYLTCWWMGIKLVYKSSVRNCQKMTNCVQFRTKIFFIKIWQKSVLKNIFPSKMSWNFLTSFYYYLKSTKHVASINDYILSCMYLWHTYEILSRLVLWLFWKTLRTDKSPFWSENSKATKIWNK